MKQQKIKISILVILLCIITVLISIWKITNKETTEAFMAAPIDRISQIPKKEPTLLSMLKTATKPMGVHDVCLWWWLE